jgi:23S rRNA (guanosine2251-2'-O)-methyltransferase
VKSIIIIAHNLRSAHNVGSLLRTAEGLGATEVILSGYTPFPPLSSHDPRLPHEQQKVAKLIHKTALNAENTQKWRREENIFDVLTKLQTEGYVVAAIEQSDTSVSLPSFSVPDKIALVLGREVEGMEPEVLAACQTVLEIPMFGSKESFNVVQAAAMALYHCRFIAQP